MKVLLLLLLTGCATKNQLIVKNFETSNSMCIDALIVNLTSEGCTSLAHEQTNNYVTLTCTNTNLGMWSGHEYYIYPTGTELNKQDAMPACSDRNATIAFSKITE
tara:strand:- start:23 stop:337 length:315 start_codon:yes stop_codon:yes gene_type:complete